MIFVDGIWINDLNRIETQIAIKSGYKWIIETSRDFVKREKQTTFFFTEQMDLLDENEHAAYYVFVDTGYVYENKEDEGLFVACCKEEDSYLAIDVWFFRKY